MPIYEYQCTSCEHCFEQKQGFDADPISICPLCQSPARRLFRPAPIIFKGSGFYVTDYNGKSPGVSENGLVESDKLETTRTPSSKKEPETTSNADE